MIKKFCPKIIRSKKNSKSVSTKIIFKKEPTEKNIIQDNTMLMCTNCGGKVIKPILPIKFKVYCIECFRPLDLPDSYYI